MPISTPGPITIPALGGDALLTYKSGGGFLPAPNNVWPAAFKSLHNLTLWWKNNGGVVYSINSVSPNTAICVYLSAALISGFTTMAGKVTFPWVPSTTYWALYMAPSTANNASHYLITYLKAPGGARTGPAVTGLRVAQYVIICNNPSLGWVDNWWFCCSPDTKKLTLRP